MEMLFQIGGVLIVAGIILAVVYHPILGMVSMVGVLFILMGSFAFVVDFFHLSGHQILIIFVYCPIFLLIFCKILLYCMIQKLQAKYASQDRLEAERQTLMDTLHEHKRQEDDEIYRHAENIKRYSQKDQEASLAEFDRLMNYDNK